MSHLFKTKSHLAAIIAGILLAVTMVTASLALLADSYGLLPDLDKPSASEPEEPSSPPEEAPPFDDEESETADKEPEPVEPEPVSFNVPSLMRGVFIAPGVDYMKTGDTTEATLRAEIDKAIDNLAGLTMNSAIILTDYGDKVIYQTLGAPELSRDFDILQYIVDKCREQGIYAYAVFNISHYENGPSTPVKMAAGAIGGVNPLKVNLEEFAEKYRLDGILIDGYVNQETQESYGLYTLLGGAIGYRNYMLHTPEAAVNTAATAIRKAAPSTQVGLLAGGVWANNYENEEGTATKAAFCSLTDGNADTRAFVESGLFDFVTVKAYGSLTSGSEPFREIASWWAGVAERAGVPLYIVHASNKICTDEAGWQPHDQLTKQAIEIDSIGGIGGSIFNDLGRLVEDPKEASTTLIKYYRQEINPEHILTELAVTKPEKTTYTTSETVVTFTGASDPNSKVTINGSEIKTDASGYFTVNYELKGGLNEFVIEHKEKTVKYAITREINILRDISPQGSITADGSMDITITAWAYEEAEVYATVGGSTVALRIDESVVTESNRDSSYKYFSGIYTAPAATSSAQNLGAITVYAKWGSETKSLQGASITVNKKAKIEDGVPIVVVADQAMTYPPNTLNNIPDAKYYPLPKGAMDYAVGNELTYVQKVGSSSTTYKYYLLASGLRVESSDIQVSNDYASGNTVKDLSIRSENGFTYVTLDTSQKVSYSINYDGYKFGVTLHNTTKTPSSSSLSSNPLFSGASWSGNSTLELTLVKPGCFMGYKGYYDENGKLVFRFNNTPSSISGARVAIDPGHGGKDTGALGFLKDYPERVINRQIANYLKADLEARGATVYLIDTSGGMSLTERVTRAEQWSADVFVSVHNNSALSASAQGTEVYYFYPFSKHFAVNTSNNVSSRLATSNRGGKQSYYTVTLSSQFPSMLVECGFMSNKNEYEKLISSGYQKAIATGIADSLAVSFNSAYSGISGGTTTTAASDPPPSSSSGEEGVWLNRATLSVGVGSTGSLISEAWLEDDDAPVVLWSSSDTSVATVDNGTVRGVSAGKATITAKIMDTNYTATCTVTVGEGSSSGSGKPTEIYIIPYGSTASVEVGKTLALDVDVTPSSASDSVSWSSDNKSVATVSASGVVTGVAAGTANITATSDEDSSVSYKCAVTVTAGAPGKALSSASSINFSAEDVYLYKSTSLTLIVDSNIGQIRASDFNWSSSDTSIATVDSLGVVTAKSKEGETTITATSKDGKKKISCYIYVTTTKEKVSDIELSEYALDMSVGETLRLSATVYPADAANKKVTYKSSRTSVVTVDANGNLTAVREGSAVITVTSDESSKITATCEINVTKDDTEIEIDVGDEYYMYVGDTEKFEVYFYPEDIKSKEVTWSSSRTSVATVDAKGNVTAKNRGTATITVALKSNPDVKYQCKVTVEE